MLAPLIFSYNVKALPEKLSELLGFISNILWSLLTVQHLALFTSSYHIIIPRASKRKKYWEDTVSKLLYLLLGEGREFSETVCFFEE